jgi:hypothetical protein
MKNKIEWLKEYNSNHSEYSNYDGLASLEGNEFMLEGNEFMATGAEVAPAAAAVAGKIVRFVVTLTNGSTSNLTSGLTLFNSWTNRVAANQGLNASITATSKGSISYLQLLGLSEIEPFEVTETLIQSSSSAQNTAISALTISSVDGNGESHSKVIDTFRRPNQYTDNQIVVDEHYRLDGSTGVAIPSLLASCTVTFFFTLIKRGSVANATFGGGAVRQYSKGNILLK